MTSSSCPLTTDRRRKSAESRGATRECSAPSGVQISGLRCRICRTGHQERCMNKLAIRILTLAMLSLTLAAAPVVSVVYAAPDNDPPPPDKKKKKSSEARPGIEQTAFADGYRAAY